MVELAAKVARRARTGLLTNNSPLLEEAFARHFRELGGTFDPILFSHRFGDIKPSVVLFERVADALETPPDELLLVDDQASHVRGARRAGWDAVQFDGLRELRKALDERGLLPR